MQLSDDELREKLTPEQYYVLRQQGTEPPFSGKLLNEKAPGVYSCTVCGTVLFNSGSKYDSHTPGLIGWPSFSEAIDSNLIKLSDDNILGMHRVEVSCKTCGSHLGHVFDDDSAPTGQHYCINSVALNFKAKN